MCAYQSAKSVATRSDKQAVLMRVFATLTILYATATAAAAEPPRLANPESIVVDGATGFVSNIGPKLEPAARDGGGFVARVDGKGVPVDGPAIPQLGTRLNAPKGLALLDGRLYVADIDRVVAFDPATGKQTAEFRPEGAKGLNDLAVAGQRLLVTDFDSGRVLALDPWTGTSTTIAQGIGGANGVVASSDGGTAWVVATGATFEGGGVTRIDLASGSATPLGNAFGVFDGVVLAKDGALIVTDWVKIGAHAPGRILRIDPATGESIPLTIPLLQGPADLARDGDRLLVPVMLENRVAELPLR